MSTIPADCVARITRALGERGAQLPLIDVARDVEQLQLEVIREGVPAGDSLKVVAQRYAKKAELAALIELRNANISAITFTERLAYVREVWAGREAEGLRAILTGSIEARRGARASVAREQTTLAGQYMGQVTTEIDRAGLMHVFKTGALDRDIGRALWQLNEKTPRLDDLPADAATIARAIHKAQEHARLDANNAGAWIGKLAGWITRQSHDPWKLVKLGQKAWIEAVLPRLDWAKMEAQHGTIANRGQWLAETWTNLAGGMHLKAAGAETDSGFRGPGNLAKRMSQERALHFKDADAWADYNEQFGMGNLRDAVLRGLKMSAQNTGLMRVLGPNPEVTYNRLVDALRRDVRSVADVKAMKKFETATAEDGWLSRRLAEVTGKANIAVDAVWARRSANLRAIQSMAKLGGAMISSLNDIATYASEMRYQGRGFLSGIGEAIGSLAQGRPAGERREILSSLGVFFDSLTAEITRTGSLDESMGGRTSRALQTFFKWNGLNWWTETLRGSAALATSHNLALNAGRAFGELSTEMRRVLTLHDITAKDWDAMRSKGIRTDEGGTSFMVPDDLPDAQARKLRRYVVDRAETAVLEPDADARAMLRQGTKPGTVVGELARFMAQFKGFSVGYTRQILGREVYGRAGADGFFDGPVYGVARLVVASTVFGYAAMTAKDLLKGKTPRDPDDPKTYLKALTQGGGAGIYGDFLFGEFNRIGQSPAETLAGPSLGAGFDAVKLWSRLVRGDADAGDALRLAQNNTPFINLFYTRLALDTLILHDMQEFVAPGTLERMQRRAKDESGQTFLVSPNDRLRPFTD
jgi:hypothetical protein